MTEPKLDPRIVRTKEAIQSVFKKMVCEMPYEKNYRKGNYRGGQN